MQPVCTVSEMQAIDSHTIGGDTTKGLALMQVAAQGLAELIHKLARETYINDVVFFPSVTIICGKGNNGGDGFKLAAILKDQKFNLKVFSLAHAEDLRGEALQAYLEISQDQTDLIRHIDKPEDLQTLQSYLSEDLQHEKSTPHFVVDSLLGIGTNGSPRGLYADTINIINKLRQEYKHLRILATDIPTGIDANNGQIHTNSIKADYTVTMGYAKLGVFFYPAKANCGKLSIHELDYPSSIVKSEHKSQTYLVEKQDLPNLIPARKADGSKYDHGVVSFIGGSEGMSGAITLAAIAAMRSGIGLAHVFVELTNRDIIAYNLIEAVTHDISVLRVKGKLTEFSSGKINAVCLGPGLGNKYNDIVYGLVKQSQVPIILDADGINAFAGKAELLAERSCQLLITPHHGEYQRLFPQDKLKDISPLALIDTLKHRARELNATILLKGNPTLIASPAGQVYINPTGNSALATAGSGDVLSGIISGFAAQLVQRPHRSEIDTLTQAAILGAYIHGRAGELASQDLTEYSVMARDIINHIPKSLKSVSN